jgi:hypothetical protein
MMRSLSFGFALAALLAVTATSYAADPPASAPAAATPATAKVDDNPPMVPPPGPGVFTVQKKGANRFHLVVAGHKFTARADIEKYLAWQAAEVTMQQKGSWFTFVELRGKGETANPAPKPDPTALRHSFQMPFFRPVWRYKVGGAWKTWSPFTTAPFPDDIKTATDFEVSADIVVKKGMMDDTTALAFEAGAVDDLLVNQVSPPT